MRGVDLLMALGARPQLWLRPWLAFPCLSVLPSALRLGLSASIHPLLAQLPSTPRQVSPSAPQPPPSSNLCLPLRWLEVHVRLARRAGRRIGRGVAFEAFLAFAYPIGGRCARRLGDRVRHAWCNGFALHATVAGKRGRMGSTAHGNQWTGT